MTENEQQAQQCLCPDQWPDWDGKDIDLGGRLAHVMSIPAFLNMPISYDLYVKKQYENLQQLELKEQWRDFVITRTGFWGGEIIRLLDESSHSPSRQVKRLEPGIHCAVSLHHGGIGTITKTVQQQQSELFNRKKRPKTLYLAHLSCPVCAERKGGEKILVLRKFV